VTVLYSLKPTFSYALIAAVLSLSTVICAFV
jgi:hypothetical protein